MAGLSKLTKGRNADIFLSGFADAEGCFNVSLKHEDTAKFGLVLDPVFHVTQHKQGQAVLELFRSRLSCGRVVEKHGQPDLMQFVVDNRRQLAEKVIPFFDKQPLVAKEKDFLLFKEIVEALERKEHSDLDSFKKLVRLAFRMNLEGKQRKSSLDEIMRELEKAGSSETIRRTP